MKRGKLIVFDGPDCCGKDTVIDHIESKYDVVVTREPGGTKIGEEIREVLLDPSNDKMDAMTSFLLFNAGRRQHLVEKVLPEIRKGNDVIMNRYYYASMVYQGMDSGMRPNDIFDIINSTITIDGDRMVPDTSIIFYSSEFSILKNRILDKDNRDRIELNDMDYFKEVNILYRDLMDSNTITMIEGNSLEDRHTIDIAPFNHKEEELFKKIDNILGSILEER